MKDSIPLFLYQKKQVKGITPLLHVSWLITESGLDPSAGCSKKNKSHWDFEENLILTFLDKQGPLSINKLVNKKAYVTSVNIRIILHLLILF